MSAPDQAAAGYHPRPSATRPELALGVGLGIAALLLLAPIWFYDPFLLHLGTMLFLSSLGAVSVHLVIRVGHVSLCQAAFMGIGSYASVACVMQLGLPWLLAAAAGILAPGLLAAVVGPIFLRLAGKYFVLVTFLFGEIVRMTFVETVAITGGANGIANIPPPAAWLDSRPSYYYLTLLVMLAVVAATAAVLKSDVGRTIDSIRDDERLAACCGIPVLTYKTAVFVAACMVIGLQGVLQAHYVRYLEPQAFATMTSLNLVVMNVIGGMYSLAGPLIGAVFVVIMPELLEQYVLLQHALFGALLIIVMVVLPGGMVEACTVLVGAVRNTWQADHGRHS